MNSESLAILNGWCNGAEKVVSPNSDERPVNTQVDLLVIHAISLPPNQFGGPYIRDFFLNRLDVCAHEYFQEIAAVEVSSHFFIDRLGYLTQFVSTDARAWHCGISSFCDRVRCNDFSIGIELEGCDSMPFSDEQYAKLAALTRAIRQAYPEISKDRIVGHADIAPGRKTDPGPCFDWSRYRHTLDNAS